MINVSSFLVKADHFCDYVPVVSSVVNLINLFQKCVVFPFKDHTAILSNYYYKKIDKKSFFRCILLMIPVIGNLIVAVHDCTKKKNYKMIIIDPAKKTAETKKKENPTVSIDEIDTIQISHGCAESFPCIHSNTIVTLKDGRKACVLDSDGIFLVVSKIPEDKINPGSEWKAQDIKKHFSTYSKPRPGWDPEAQGNRVEVSFKVTDEEKIADPCV